jgi:transcriptional regulator with XRE-family HTH domain
VSELRVRVGTRLREWRRRRGLTQEQLAARAGLSYKFIGEIERGTGNPTLETLGRLAAALRVDLAELVREPEPHRESSPTYVLSAREIQLVREALESVDQLIDRLEPSPVYPKPKRRRK